MPTISLFFFLLSFSLLNQQKPNNELKFEVKPLKSLAMLQCTCSHFLKCLIHIYISLFNCVVIYYTLYLFTSTDICDWDQTFYDKIVQYMHFAFFIWQLVFLQPPVETYWKMTTTRTKPLKADCLQTLEEATSVYGSLLSRGA